MLVMNGEEATREIRTSKTTQNRSTTIIALTTDAIVGVRERLLASGMDDYLVKPITIAGINSIVKKYLPADKIIIVKMSSETTRLLPCNTSRMKRGNLIGNF